MKVTPQRQRIFAALHGNDRHPTADAIFDEVRADMPTISLRTVYQTLNDLAAMGEVAPIDLGTGATRFDPNLIEHHHLVCDVCGTIVDVDAIAGIEPPGDAEPTFVVTRTDVVFRGNCGACAARPSPV